MPTPCQCETPLAMSHGNLCGYCGGLLRGTIADLVSDYDHARGPDERARAAAIADAAIRRYLDHAAETGRQMVTEATYDPTQTPGVYQLPATTTDLTPEQFRQWLNMPGRLYIVYLPGRKSFVIKVPDEHDAFFVDMLKQLRLTLGPEVQAQAATPLPDPADNPEPRPPEQVGHRHPPRRPALYVDQIESTIISDASTCGMGDEQLCSHGTNTGRYCPDCDADDYEQG